MNVTIRHSISAALFAIVSCAFAQNPPPRPNIVYVLLDDVRWDDLGAMGHPWARTPNFDRVAREGALFRNAFSVTPLCSPSRGTILTGQYAHTHGIIDNIERGPRSHELVTFPRLLHDAGYIAAFIGKWHMGVDDTPRPGFDHWFALQGQGSYFDPEVNENGTRRKIPGYSTDIFNQQAVAFIRQRPAKPFVLFLAHKAVHPETSRNPDGSARRGAESYTPAERCGPIAGNTSITSTWKAWTSSTTSSGILTRCAMSSAIPPPRRRSPR